MGWNPIKLPIDFFILQGRPNPGIGRIEKASSPRKWDEIGGYGASGSVLIFHGRRLVPFDGIVELYTEEDWEYWDQWKELVMRPPYGKIPKAKDIWHPWLELLEVRSAVVTDVLQPEDMGNGGHRIVIQFLEHRRPKLQLSAPAAAEQKPQSTDPVDKYIEQLTSQVQELAR